MSDSLVALFPGQGSQKVGMGLSLFQESQLAKTRFEEADDILGFKLSKICFEGPLEQLTATEVAQPAILTTSVICYQLAKEELGDRLSPKAAAGHSLGEYSALVAANVLSFADAVSLVNARGKFMQEAVPSGKGKMYAILSKEVSELEEEIQKYLATQQNNAVLEIANINAPGQIVIAGDALACDQFIAGLAGTRCIELPVSAPFHCQLMKPAEEKLSPKLQQTVFRDALFPIYSNYTASASQNSDTLRQNLIKQVCGRVRWVESMQNAIQETSCTQVVEFGFGNVLTGLQKRISPSTTRVNIDSLSAIALLK